MDVDLSCIKDNNDLVRQRLADILFDIREDGSVHKKAAVYIAKLFPNMLIDIARYLSEQAIQNSRNSYEDPGLKIRNQLKPYLAYNLLLGKCPQITGLMYNYFENSSFQPLPENLFSITNDNVITYSYPGFNDELVKQILLSLFKYLSFNPKWFSSVWNWSELGRFITVHKNNDIRYLAACCLSIITKPTRIQHISMLNNTISNDEELLDLQIAHRHIFDNTFKPCIETKKEKAQQFAISYGFQESDYIYCNELLTKVANIFLIKRDISAISKEFKNQHQWILNNYVPVTTLTNTMSKIAYSISINKPCLIRGACGSGKTAMLDYIAAHTNRINPPDYVKVQIGDQLDSKLLIGSYVCTEIPGQFDWQPGPLTKAMAYGSWIVFEDIDSAPSEMAQVIHSVIENGNLSCVSSCPIKLESPHPDFRIFFTQRISENNKSDNNIKLGFGFVERLCDIIDLPQFNDEDLLIVLQKRYNCQELTKTILKIFRKSQQIVRDLNSSTSSRVISLRDLFKFCDRLKGRNLKLDSEKISTTDLETIYLDAIDCFLGALPKYDLKKPAEMLGEIINIPANEVERLVFLRMPEIRQDSGSINIGRVQIKTSNSDQEFSFNSKFTMANTKQTLQLIEKVSLCIKQSEPVLLVGETGVGKTSVVQHLAERMSMKLNVVNLSQQSDSSDLLGDYKPVEIRDIMSPLNEQFDKLFTRTFDSESNRKFLQHVSDCYASAKQSNSWSIYLKLICHLCTKAIDKPIDRNILNQWNQLHNKALKLSKRLTSIKETSPMALAFSEGTLLRAVRKGEWILLDEINLAEPEVLQCLILILDSIKTSSLYMNNLDEDEKPITIHSKFRIFACMNPSTDIGKRDLASGTRGRFTELFVDDITEPNDLRLIVESYVKSCLSTIQIDRIVTFYQEIRSRKNALNDISGNSPNYSLRTLCRALTICANNVCCNMEKSLYESLKITFLQQLNELSVLMVMQVMEKTVFDAKSLTSLKNVPIPRPKDNHNYIDVQGFWIQTSSETPQVDEKYIITESVIKNLKSIARIVSLGQRKLPILIQGNTSVGKTSLIMHMAKLTGNKCYRINNHEHTDLQEYLGRYVFKENGKLVFQEGLLVRAMKKGYWIILDELNLAPSELLEALNRVLDDNRELFIPETRETIKAHSKFMLFATQNPPEEYAGRKLLSRAFRNRFIELHFDEIPSNELEIILEKRCEMPPQYAKKIVNVMKELQLLRRETGCFNGKNSFMTMRDLFRWGERYATFKKNFAEGQFLDWDLHLATEGLILLEGRVRTINEAEVVKTTIEKVFKKTLDRKSIYYEEKYTPSTFSQQFKHIYFSYEFQRLFTQLSRAFTYKEPVLLCGQTGCGKTTACQLYAALKGNELLTYNCHLNTESSDFVGGVRPSRCEAESVDSFTFPWIDGPLVQAMKKGSIFLMDEISLADDAVLERINSVLEPTRSITLTEKDGEEFYANPNFLLVATMNPGGDYGKKELSPALRNRFTEIYCHNTTDIDQIKRIMEAYLSPSLLKPKIAPALLSIAEKFLREYYKNHTILSIRDVLSWCTFLNKTTQVKQPRPLSIQEAIVNGVSLIFFDQFGTCGHKSFANDLDFDFKKNLKTMLKKTIDTKFGKSPIYVEPITNEKILNQDVVSFLKFYLYVKPATQKINSYQINPKQVKLEFILDTPIVKRNVMKIVRAMQLDRPILLEGDPGSGKTSVVDALAKLTGHKLVRINLSEQTDISDLFGSDLPDLTNMDSNEENSPKFTWHDGPMLRAIKESHWILLDEMNLASQSVLEGLNACFDHRSEIFIPELGKKFNINRSSTRIFASQNPYNQGSARKGLPQSFLNRFTSIYIESHSSKDLITIIEKLHPKLPKHLVQNMVEFNSLVSSMHKNSGFEFNLRDLLHWCDLMTRCVNGDKFKLLNLYRPDKFVQFVYLDRMRSPHDKAEICDMFERIFNCPIYEPPYRDIKVGEYSLITCRSILPRKNRPQPHLPELCVLKYQMPYIESIAKAIEHHKMPIIVGESGVGKRSMIRILAGLTGNELNIICANEEMDTMELLGSYEQKSLQRDIADLVEKAKKLLCNMINSITQKNCADTWTSLFSHMWAILYATSSRDLKLSRTEMMDAHYFQLSQMKELIEKILLMCTSEFKQECQILIQRINSLMIKSNYSKESSDVSGSFEWIDSILIKSIREGSWLMIENANLLNPATLDRLNPLVESNGVLSMNEKGSNSDGTIEILKPHPDFRLILTMNPQHGELSRAMRNRGVEIYVQTRFYFEDFLMLLEQNGFEPEENTSCMTYCVMQTSYDFHKKVTEEVPEEDGALLSYFGLNYISTLTHEVRRGQEIDNVLFDLLTAFYKQRGYVEECSSEELQPFIMEKLNVYRRSYEVNLNDERYKWRHLRHDLVSLTGGDAVTAMLDRDNRIFFYDFNIDLLLRPEEMIENLDIVNTSTQVKIFLELATHGDFQHRKGFIKETFQEFGNIMNIVNKHVDLLYNEHIPLIKTLLPRIDLAPVSEWNIDSRNSPDSHYYLSALDYDQVMKQKGHQNRWILSLHRIMLSMIVELVEERTLPSKENNNQIKENTYINSLWLMSEEYREAKIAKENLIKPVVEIVSDLYDLLDGILRFISNRCFNDSLVSKMLAKLFWISYFICKLKKGHTYNELIAICNQLPMLWALTYQKVIVPIIKDCEMADLVYKNRKFSHRIQQICDGLEITVAKPSSVEKDYYNKLVNSYAVTTKITDVTSKEMDKCFATVVERYASKTQSFNLGSDNQDTLIASGSIWTNSTYMESFYNAAEILLDADIAYKQSYEEGTVSNSSHEQSYEMARKLVVDKVNDYNYHEVCLKRDNIYKSKCTNLNRRRNALNQYAPLWQFHLLQPMVANLLPTDINYTPDLVEKFRTMLQKVNGLIMSPRYYSTIIKYLKTLINRKELESSNTRGAIDFTKILKEDLNMYSAFLADQLFETVVLDHQIVGWTKMRTTTSDLPSLAPLIPEYSPIVSLVGSYCLDISHLKLNSYTDSTSQLELMIMYLWRNYAQVKLNSNRDLEDLTLAKNLIHLRCNLGYTEELVGSYQCNSPKECQCIEHYIKKRSHLYLKLLNTQFSSLEPEDVEIYHKAIKLIQFGYYNYLEYAPIFSFDPAIRSREKLEVYRSELAHVKLDLHFRNTLFYWKTGENLQLNEIDPEEALYYPFSTQVLIERRVKLEKSINRLRREHTNRPKSDDGSLYFDLRKEVEVNMKHFESGIEALMNAFIDYITCPQNKKESKLYTLVSRCPSFIKRLERTISKMRADYSLYSDLTTNFILGLCFVQQGIRCLYARLEQKMTIANLGFDCSIKEFRTNIMKVFSFNNFNQGNINSVMEKLNFYPLLKRICPEDKCHKMQSIVLRTVLIQLNNHIIITPSDIPRCFPIVRKITDSFNVAWIRHKRELERIRRELEETYQYKTSRTTLGNEISYEKQEFIDICASFPTYDHVYQNFFQIPGTSVDKENLNTEQQMCNLDHHVDLTMCIDICKAHYKFIREASCSLLGQVKLDSSIENLHSIDMSKMTELEAQVLYSITRNCIPALDKSFDSLSLECHLLQAHQLNRILQEKKFDNYQSNSLKSSIEILDDEIFDIYHDPNAYEALKFQEYLTKLDFRIGNLRNIQEKGYENDVTLIGIIRLIRKISSFLITDPMMKFITGSHTLLEKIEIWNRSSIPKEDKMIVEADNLVDMIKSWRKIEVESWKNSLHKVKRKYIDNTLCDLWFVLYQAFNDPIVHVRDMMRQLSNVQNFKLVEKNSENFYKGFVCFIKNFLEESTIGDYNIRLDLVHSFSIQMRFASLYHQARPNYLASNKLTEEEKKFVIDFEKLMAYVHNTYIQFQGLFKSVDDVLRKHEEDLTKELNTEIKIVAWQGRNLWEIKNNFRISHRKLNKVMNKYREILKRPVPGIRPASEDDIKSKLDVVETESDKIDATLLSIQLIIDNVQPPRRNWLTRLPGSLNSLNKTPNIVKKMKQFHSKLSNGMIERHVKNLVTIEDNFIFNKDAIINFKSHQVEDVIIKPKDTKEEKEEKHKLCRQMYHSKKHLLQMVFKNLNQLGVSYKRGLNSSSAIDGHVLTLNPLRGMIKNQNLSVLKSLSGLVHDNLVMSCNEEYYDLIAFNMYLQSDHEYYIKQSGLNGDQLQRIYGYSLDLVTDIINHLKVSASIYEQIIDIQACTMRLQQLQQTKKSSEKIIVYNFKKFYSSVSSFNDLVGRSILAILKLEELCKCFDKSYYEQVDTAVSNETSILKTFIGEFDENNSLMTQLQMEKFQCDLVKSKKRICEVSYKLRDMLNNTNRNYLFSDDSIDFLETLYQEFYEAFEKLIPKDTLTPNMEPGTVLASLKSLLDETNFELKPKLNKSYFLQDDNGLVPDVVNLNDHPNVKRMNLRLKNLLKQIKLAVQEVYKNEIQYYDETSKDKQQQLVSEETKRKLKPFNYVDSVRIKNLLRTDKIAEQIGDCFKTSNISQVGTNLEPIITALAPILMIYIQEVASYLNIILSSVKLKLKLSNQLIVFFTDLLIKGFGLPYKVSEQDDSNGQQQSKACAEDNVGFGEGQGESDVSKKLEYESQLDDLKKDDTNEVKDNKEDEKFIEAHDDGVEMSTDLDTKAQGADEEQTQEEADDQLDDDEDELNELDKELDTVDQDEGKLDQNLWDDNDDGEADEEEDDKEDLRETQVDSDMCPKKEETDLQAKDEKLTESKQSDKKEPCDDTNKMNEDESSELLEKEESVEPQKQLPSSNEATEETEEVEQENDDDQFDMEAEVDLAEKEANKEDDNEDEGEADMSIDLENIEDDESIHLADDASKTDNNKEDDAKSEGEIDGDDSQDDSITGNEIDEDELHNQLEAGVTMNNPLIDEQLPDPIQESIKQKAEQNKACQDSSYKNDRQRLGANTVYYIYPKEEDNSENLEYDDEVEEEEEQQQQPTDNDKSMAMEETLKDQMPIDGDSKKIEKNNKDDDDKEHIKKDNEQESPNNDNKIKTPKRTVAEDEETNRENIKRQKISSKDSDKDKKDDDNDKQSTDNEQEKNKNQNQNKPVKHAQENSKNAYEVIDLVSSDEENQEILKSTFEMDDKEKEKQEQDINVNLMEQIDNELKRKHTAKEHDSLDADRLTGLWIDCTRQTSHLVQELCQQLQIVLQPTKMAKYKGDYKSGKRLNMRKIISYIASFYMKDKIWLRRTKPSKRTYNIMIAVDNSSSMHENNCRQMTFQSLALLAKSLSLIEAGSLSVVKFGEQFRCIHEFGQPYMDAIGAQWLRELRFDDTRTSYMKLLKHSCESFAKQTGYNSTVKEGNSTGDAGSASQLLIIISDGRNVSSEEDEVKTYLKQLRAMKVLTLFIIIDDLNRNNGCSIVDVKRPIGTGTNLRMVSYMEFFPFPFYVLLHRLDMMPSVLGQALRQWFELVSSNN